MIERLSVRDFILVDSLDLDFTSGFNVMSGETGAGKSILVGALSVLLGAKGGTDLVREGAEESVVAGEFLVDGHPAATAWLAERGIEPEDGRVLVRRTIKRSGRGVISIDATPVTRTELEEFAGLLLDLHSQHEHQSLFSESNHRRIVDRFAELDNAVSSFQISFNRLSEVQGLLRDLETQQKDRNREIEMLEFALSEIEAAELRPGEVEELENERDRMVQFEKLAEHVASISETLDGNEYAALALLKRCRQDYSAAARIDSSLTGDQERLNSVYFELEDLAQNLAEFRDSLRFDPIRLEEIEDRLNTVRRLQRKYGDSIEEILLYRNEASRKLEGLRSFEENRDGLRKELAELETSIGRQARELHQKRIVAAKELKERIERVLSDLRMGEGHFEIEVEARSNERGRLVCGPSGADTIRFLISTNPGVPPQALSRVASGGELSRVMLAIKTVVADVDDVRSLIFDEIDTGIGGQVALSIASYMRKLADSTQVISITHLATIAVRADNHIVVEKYSESGHTRITATTVGGERRIKEIARMLAGEQEESSGVEHARALLDRYKREGHGEDQ